MKAAINTITPIMHTVIQAKEKADKEAKDAMEAAKSVEAKFKSQETQPI